MLGFSVEKRHKSNASLSASDLKAIFDAYRQSVQRPKKLSFASALIQIFRPSKTFIKKDLGKA